MFPTAVKGHIPFAPTYSERVEKHQQERRRRASNSVSGGEHAPKRKAGASSNSCVQSQPARSGSSVSKSSSRNAVSLGALQETNDERYARLCFSSDSQIAVSTATFRKTSDLHVSESPSECNRKRATFLKSILNLFRRRTRLSIDVRTHPEKRAVDQERLDVLGNAVTTGTTTTTTDCTSDCDAGQSTPNHQGRQRRSNTQRLESILEEDAESDANENVLVNDAESDSAIDVQEDESSAERVIS